jgi:hypothetical protein
VREYILIDFENVQPTTLQGVDAGNCEVLLFHGANQKSMSMALSKELLRLGKAVELVKIEGAGPNAVDFHIAYKIGQLSAAEPAAKFTIISRDTGFDPLIRYITKSGVSCRRVAVPGPGTGAKPSPKPKASAKQTPVKPGPPKPQTPLSPHASEAAARLKGLKAARPRRLKTLQSSIKSWFKPVLGDADVAAIIRRLTDAGHVVVNPEGKVTYSLP